MKIFNPLHTPLTGTNLIEASAGTGKTYSIAGLFLRLILEKHFTADQILVVTFTQAATEELKDRIRNTLLRAKSAFLTRSSDDIFIHTLVQNHQEPAAAVQRIQDALVDFDNAAIFTIHGFCQRILHENAFETQRLFDTELVSDQTHLNQEISDDFWREHFYRSPPEFLSYAVQKTSGPTYFLKLLAKKKAPEIRVVPAVTKPHLKSLDDYRTIFKQLKAAWPAAKDKATSADCGLKSPSLNGTVYGSLKTQADHSGLSKRDQNVMILCDAMDRFADEKSAGFPFFKGFEKFTATKLIRSTKKKHAPPSHDFFNVCDALYQKGVVLESEMEKYLLFLKTQYLKYAQEQLVIRKKNSNTQFFDDLLFKVKNALEGKEGNTLVRVIQQKYKAALVDEFQDTDSIQYKIFSRCFDSKQSSLFMIGDPKQAIYGFRGADIFSYLKAARNMEHNYTLTENWRSTPGLITAVNKIFSNVQKPFVFDQIRFEKGTAGKKTESIGDISASPMTIWYLEAKKNPHKPLSKAEAVPLIARAVSGEISRLISPTQTDVLNSSTDCYKAGDIAVLVRTNRQAHIVKQHLSSKQIPSVLYNTGNVFHTHEAMEVERILSSISEPANERLLKAALITDMMGVKGKELDSDNWDALWREKRSASFREYFRQWSQHGFLRMFRLLLAKEKAKERLLMFPDGERRLANVLHLAEILHQKSVESAPGMTGLLKWLSDQRNAASTGSEEFQLRLESDDNAVRIITIHKSKGLEYPVVFCPFAWDGAVIKEQEFAFHDQNRNQELTLDLGSDENSTHLTVAQDELLAENLRLLYVALTRAIKQCYLVWGRIINAETSALAYLFHYNLKPQDMIQKQGIVAALKTNMATKKHKVLYDDLKRLTDTSDGSIDLVSMPTGDGMKYTAPKIAKKQGVCRQFSGTIDTTWKISSYSYLVSKRTFEEALPDRDAFRDVNRFSQANQWSFFEKPDIFSFPKGARAGIFFHDVFEHLDFAATDSDHKEQLVAVKLKSYGFEPKWQAPVCAMIDNVLSLQLRANQATVALSSVQCKDRINEMEFYFSLNPTTPQKLKDIFASYGGISFPATFPEQIGKLAFPLTKGFMKGYIDLIFRAKERYYILDWKSNFLGSRVEDYGKEALRQVMNKELYTLQYLLYALALHQYLTQRLPGYSYEKCFGGVFFVFIRGVDPAKGPEFGIYKDLPPQGLIHALGESLISRFSA